MKNNVSFNSTLSKFGMGLFETIKVTEYPIDLDLHMDRLYSSINKLNLNTKYEKLFLKNEILRYINENKVCNKALRLTVFDEGYNISLREIPYNTKIYEKGFKLNISPIKRGDSIIYKHKTTNYFENIYTKKYANANGFDDGLFLNAENIILECSMSNIFFIKDKTIFTPHKDLPILNGTMKKRIIDICDELNIILREEKIKISQISDFEFAFATNSLMEVMKITQIEDVFYDKSNEIFNKILTCV